MNQGQEQEDELDNEIQQGKKVVDEDNEDIKTNLIYELKNIADLIPEHTRQSIAKDVMDNLNNDKKSREQYELKTYKGLCILSFKKLNTAANILDSAMNIEKSAPSSSLSAGLGFIQIGLLASCIQCPC